MASQPTANFIKDLQETCSALDLKPKVLAVKDFRDRIPQVREQAHNGAVLLVADRADAKDAKETTMVLSVETFQNFVAKAVETALEAKRRHSNTREFLAGLAPVEGTAAAFEIDFDREARAEAKLPSDLKL